MTLKESLADSEQRPARDGVADGWRREEELGAGVDLWQLRGGMERDQNGTKLKVRKEPVCDYIAGKGNRI